MALDSSFGSEQRSSTANVNITIVDVNNKAPEFGEIPTAVVPEDAPNQHFVTKVLATDLDDKPVLRYSIDYTRSEARNEFGATVDYNLFADSFTINPLDGTVRVVKILNRELWDQIKLYLVVEDIAAATKGQKAKVDVNNKAPEFGEIPTAVVPEDAPNQHFVTKVLATDLDDKPVLRYSIDYTRSEARNEFGATVDYNLFADSFTINPLDGTVRVVKILNRELWDQIKLYLVVEDIAAATKGQKAKVFWPLHRQRLAYLSLAIRTYLHCVKATDTGQPPLTGLSLLSIQVLDENDNNPVFVGEQRQAFMIAEDAPIGSLVAQVSARDEDSVTVTDVNDEIPTIVAQTSDCAIVNEFHPIRDMITFVTAIDGDDANTGNGKVVFAIIDGNKDRLFDFEHSPPNAGKLISRSSLRGRVGNYTLSVKAEDGGRPQLSSTANIHICVTDVNDHNPMFVKPPSNITIRIPENATIGSTVVEVMATDEDWGVNAVVRYKLRQLPNNHWRSFAINEVTGVITVAKQLDREAQRVHELRVQAYDLGEPTSLSTDLDLTILVANVDDFEPEFTQDVFQVVFTENTLPEIEKYKLLPTIDKDDYDLIDPAVGFKSIPCYHIVGGDGGHLFRLNTFTHELTTTQSLDREFKDNYTLIVQATNDCFKIPPNITHFDNKDNSLLQVLIGVRDVNDNSP
ncbi:unnamed protein product, partial [Medioppia subpectinata]